MRTLGLIGVRRDKHVRTTERAKDGQSSSRTGDLLDRDFTATAPKLVWVTEFARTGSAAPRAVRACVEVNHPRVNWERPSSSSTMPRIRDDCEAVLHPERRVLMASIPPSAEQIGVMMSQAIAEVHTRP